MANTYFCCYDSYLEGFENLNDAEVGRLIRACINYHMSGQVVELDGNEKYIFPMIKGQIDRDTAVYDTKCKQLSDNAKKRYKSDLESQESKSMQMDANACKSTQREKEKEEEREEEKDKERERENSLSKGGRAMARESEPPLKSCEITMQIVDEIVCKLNKAWHTRFRADNPAVSSCIADRWRKGADMQSFENVIDMAAELWGSDPKMMNALNPYTVFNDKNYPRFANALAPEDASAIIFSS